MFRNLQLVNFRSYENFKVDFSPNVTVIVGPNGTGKTNLLEAIYVLAAGTSFRNSDKEMLRHGQQWTRMTAFFGDTTRVVKLKKEVDKLEKQFEVDGSKKARLTYNLRLPIVLFEPDHLRILKSSPSGRREYLDGLLARLQPDFTWLHHQYDRVLQQRNALLKRHLAGEQLKDQIFAWDIRLVDLANTLVERRLEIIELLNARFSDVYSKIAGSTFELKIDYQSSVQILSYQANLMQVLTKSLPLDLHRGFTTHGPHRDDFGVQIDRSDAAVTASRGEVRSMLLALKIIELELLADRSDKPPTLLLDDVFSELDAQRREALIKVAKKHQTFITTTDADLVYKYLSGDSKVIKTS